MIKLSLYYLGHRGGCTMNLVEILTDKSIKKMAARGLIVEGILDGSFGLAAIRQAAEVLKANKVATILEAIEEISNKAMMPLEEGFLEFAKAYVKSENNSCKREASRIVGNLAAQYPQALDDVIPALLENTHDEGTVVRWGSAYALSRIILLDAYSETALCDQVKAICEAEKENGVKNQYVKALKKLVRRKH